MSQITICCDPWETIVFWCSSYETSPAFISPPHSSIWCPVSKAGRTEGLGSQGEAALSHGQSRSWRRGRGPTSEWIKDLLLPCTETRHPNYWTETANQDKSLRVWGSFLFVLFCLVCNLREAKEVTKSVSDLIQEKRTQLLRGSGADNEGRGGVNKWNFWCTVWILFIQHDDYIWSHSLGS